MAEMYDLCIVGAGMIGSAAARHASALPGLKVCLVGPSEPKTRSMGDNRDIYGAHYDEGRITRSCDADPVWATLALESIRRYRDIEKKSGIQFYKEVGHLNVAPKSEAFHAKIRENAKRQKAQVKSMDGSGLRETFPYLRFATSDEGLLEEKEAGNISPRNLVQAQKDIASMHGCTIIDDVANNVSRTVQSNLSYVMTVSTSKGQKLYAKKVLLATGAFMSSRNLLPGITPDQSLCPLTVALVEVGNDDANRLRDMPSVFYTGPGHQDWEQAFPRNEDGTVSFYMLPPVKYPDGRYYIKLGHFHGSVKERLSSAHALKSWYVNGNKERAETTARFITSLMPDIKMKSWKADYCVVVETPTNRPYVDQIHSQLSVAFGGNGYAAKSSDEIGRLGVNVALGRKWDSTIPQRLLAFRSTSAGYRGQTNSKL